MKKDTPIRLQATSYKLQAGFSLVEVIVAVGIFSVVMMIAVSSLLSLVAGDRKAQAQQVLVNNLNFALENMTRNIRTGRTYHCGSSGSVTAVQDWLSGDSYFAFEGRDGNPSSAGDQIVYRLSGTQIEKSTDGGTSFVGITAPEIIVEGLSFYVEGTPAADSKQPKTLITLFGHASADRSRVDFNLQTLISQRFYDL